MRLRITATLLLAIAIARVSIAREAGLDDTGLPAIVRECVEAQRNAGNTNVYSPVNSDVTASTLIKARVRYIPNYAEITISLIPDKPYPDAPWGKCVVNSEDGALSAITFSLGGAHFEGKSYRPLTTDAMTESELKEHIERKDWVTTIVDIRITEEK